MTLFFPPLGTPIRRRKAFTLLELLVVVSIIAALAGAALVAYDRLETRASKGQSAYNISAVDKSVRAFRVVSKKLPDDLDSLITDNVSDAALTAGKVVNTVGTGGFYAGIATELSGKLGFHRLIAEEVTVLSNEGIAALRDIDGSTNTVGKIPNRDFDPSPTGKGLTEAIATDTIVPVIRLGSQLLVDLGLNSRDVVLAIGLGNNSSMVDVSGGDGANMAEAPYASSVKKNQYGRFLLLVKVANDANSNDTVASTEVVTTVQFVGVLDPLGRYLDETYAGSTGQNE